MDKKEKAIALHDIGYNCCQAVVCSFYEKDDPTYATLFKAGEGLGYGLGCANGVCGALSGAVMIVGMNNSTACLDKPNSKPATYKLAAGVYDEFQKRCGGIICRDIKGMDTGKVLCSCPDCIKHGIDIAEEVISKL